METAFVALLTVPVLYEKYEDQVDAYAEKAMIEFKKQYAVFDAKVLSRIPKGPLKGKKKDWKIVISWLFQPTSDVVLFARS